jgi:hypothetical protein
MIGRENRVILGSFGLFALVVIGIGGLEQALRIPVGDYPLVTFFVAVGIPIVLPQLYLAWTDDEIAPRTRLWFAVIFSGLVALAFVSGPSDLQEWLVLSLVGTALLVLGWYEARAAYRESIANGDPT